MFLTSAAAKKVDSRFKKTMKTSLKALTAHAAQYQKHKQPNPKMGRRPK